MLFIWYDDGDSKQWVPASPRWRWRTHRLRHRSGSAAKPTGCGGTQPVASCSSGTTDGNSAQWVPATPSTLNSSGSNSVLLQGVRGDGTDETTAIQAAIDTTPAGGTLLFPTPMSVYLASKLTISKSIYLVGVGDTSILRQTPNSGGQLIEITANGIQLLLSAT